MYRPTSHSPCCVCSQATGHSQRGRVTLHLSSPHSLIHGSMGPWVWQGLTSPSFIRTYRNNPSYGSTILTELLVLQSPVSVEAEARPWKRSSVPASLPCCLVSTKQHDSGRIGSQSDVLNPLCAGGGNEGRSTWTHHRVR